MKRKAKDEVKILKKGTIIGILVAIGIIIAGVIGSVSLYKHNENIKKNNIKPVTKVSDTKEQANDKKTAQAKVDNAKKENTIGEVGGKTTNHNYPTTDVIGQYNSYTIPKYIQEIEKTNYDTDYYWDTSMQNINSTLQGWYNQYQEKDIKTILDNESNIPSYLVRLAVMHPESIPFVAGYHGYKLNNPISLDGYTKEGKIPLFQQWDKQWGYDWYGNGPIAMDGCGPTSLAMIIVGLTGNMNANPRTVAQYSANNGGYSWNHGSNQDLFTGVAEHFGLVAHQISGNQIIEQLKMGRPVMMSCHAGNFTLSGHIIVLSGVTPDGQIIINNPDSIKDSMQTWSLQTILNNMNYAYSYSKA
ncbi:MAG: C39 family peptidase [Sarcina sp.]